MKRALPFAVGLLALTLVLAAGVEARRLQPVALTPTLTGQPEYCVSCHADLPEISPSHPTAAFGCVICHGGERLALDAELAHSTLRGGRNPSDLAVVEASCGGEKCHSGAAADARDHIQRVQTSVQATYAGAIAQMLYTFGAQSGQTARFGVYAIEDDLVTTATGLPRLAQFEPAQTANPALLDFARNCLNCHLGAEPLPGAEYARFTGCAACHTPAFAPPLAAAPVQNPGGVHQLTTTIPYTQCNTCHNRGNYSLRDLQFHPRTDLDGSSTERPEVDRLHAYYQPIAQFTKCEYELDCVDCHTNSEAMGDSDLHSSKKEVQYLQCRDCHGTLAESPVTKVLTDPNDLAFRLALLNPVIDLQVSDTIVVTEKGEPLWNVRRRADGSFELVGKVTRATYAVPLVQGSACEQKPDEQNSAACHACHAVER